MIEKVFSLGGASFGAAGWLGGRCRDSRAGLLGSAGSGWNGWGVEVGETLSVIGNRPGPGDMLETMTSQRPGSGAFGRSAEARPCRTGIRIAPESECPWFGRGGGSENAQAPAEAIEAARRSSDQNRRATPTVVISPHETPEVVRKP
jgi:hypothetical protein